MSHNVKRSVPIAIPTRNPSKKSTLRCAALPTEIQPYLDSVDIVSSAPAVHASGLMGPSVTIGPLATSFHWMDDAESDSCLCCQVKFNLLNRPHHCRVCGSLVCGACSKEQKCPSKLVHEQPTSASVLWGKAQTALNFMSKWGGGGGQQVSPKTPERSSDTVVTRVCRDCETKIKNHDILCLYNLLETVFQDTSQYSVNLDLRNWDALEQKGAEWKRLVSIFRQAMARSQHFVTNPWIEGYRNATILQKKLQTLLLWANQPLFKNHYFYTHAWRTQQPIFREYWPHLVGKAPPISLLEPGHEEGVNGDGDERGRDLQEDASRAVDCERMRCKVRCDAEPTLEIQMHMLFSKSRIQEQHAPTMSLSLALALMPTMLIRGIRDSFYIRCLRHALTAHGSEFGAPLYFWLQSIVCTGAYLDQIGNLLSTQDLSRFSASFKWGNTICQALRHCKGDLKHKEVRRLTAHPKVLLPGSHNLVVETIHLDNIKRTDSNSSPYMVPCILRNTDDGTVSKQVLLVKHKQSMFNDWVSMALIKLCAVITTQDNVKTYHMAPIGYYSGILVIVPESITVYEATLKTTIFNIIYAAQPEPKPPVVDLWNTFSSSLAFFTILSCFLGWRDRIESNMMVHPKSGTIFHIDFEYMAALAPPWKATLRKYSGSKGGGFERSGDSVTMTSLIPPPVIEMIGGYQSNFYNTTFKADCNRFYSEFYKLRHVFYYATECLRSAPSRIGRLDVASHEQFFRNLELTFLRGIIINPGSAPGGGGVNQVPITPLVIEPEQQKKWGIEGLFATMHSVVQKVRSLK